ncbi:MAG: carbon-nitrogen hydrolase family protein [Candidatus Bipolaricaulaceae bacterium]
MSAPREDDQVFVLYLQIDPGGDVEHNLAQVDHHLQRARANYGRFDLICLPEYFSLGIRKRLGVRTAQRITRRSLAALRRWAEESRAYVVAGTVPEVHRGTLYDTAFLLDKGGGVVASYRKMHLYADWGETAIFRAGAEVKVVDLPFTKLGIAVCRDLRFPRLFGDQRAQGAEVFCVPTSWNYPYDVDWEVLGRCRALENQAYFVLANITGVHQGEQFFGRSMVVDFRGNVISMMDDRPGYQVAHLDLAALREWRNTFRVFAYQEAREELHARQVVDGGAEGGA